MCTVLTGSGVRTVLRTQLFAAPCTAAPTSLRRWQSLGPGQRVPVTVTTAQGGTRTVYVALGSAPRKLAFSTAQLTGRPLRASPAGAPTAALLAGI
jgi:hypothetical protein